MSALELKDAGIRIDGHWLVRNVSLTAEKGELLAFVGPNGAGKSTLLRLLCGLWSPTEGSVEVEGQPVHSLAARELAKKIAFVAQSSQIQYPFTVREVAAMGRYPHERRLRQPGPEDREAVDRAMERTDVTYLADRYANHLSGGELQRVLLARCLASEADTILLDEPTSNLDLLHTLDVLEICRELATEGRAIVMAIHDLNSAIRYADRVVVLSKGLQVASGATSEVLTPERIEEVFEVRAETVTSPMGVQGLLFSR